MNPSADAAAEPPEPRAVRYSRWSLFTGGLFFSVAFFLPFVHGCVPSSHVSEQFANANPDVLKSVDNMFYFMSNFGAFLFPYLHGFFIAAAALLAWHARHAFLPKILVAGACISVAFESICQFKWYCDIRMNVGSIGVTLTPYNIGPLFMLGWLIVGLLILTVRNAADGRAKILWTAAAAVLPHFVWHAHFAGRSDTSISIGWCLGAAGTLLYLLSAIFGLRALSRQPQVNVEKPMNIMP